MTSEIRDTKRKGDKKQEDVNKNEVGKSYNNKQEGDATPALDINDDWGNTSEDNANNNNDDGWDDDPNNDNSTSLDTNGRDREELDEDSDDEVDNDGEEIIKDSKSEVEEVNSSKITSNDEGTSSTTNNSASAVPSTQAISPTSANAGQHFSSGSSSSSSSQTSSLPTKSGSSSPISDEKENQNNEEADFLTHKLLADEGLAQAQYNLGLCYLSGKGVPHVDELEAVHWFEKAAEQDHVDAQYDLGLCYLNGSELVAERTRVKAELAGVAMTKEGMAVNSFTSAADRGHVGAQYHLGLCYLNGNGVAVNKEEAVRWFYKAVEQGHVNAQYHLALCYYNGNGVGVNEKEAVYRFEKAAKQYHADAQYHLGLCCLNGEGVAKNEKEAVEWFKKAERQGNVNARAYLGFCYEYGKGVKADIKEAGEFYRKVIISKDEIAEEALLNVAALFPANDKEAKEKNIVVKHFPTDVEYIGTGNPMASASAYGFLSLQEMKDSASVSKLFHTSLETIRLKRLKVAAANGNSEAQYNLGIYYENVKKVDLAIGWYTLAYNQGHNNASRKLSKYYEYGIGVNNKKEAIRWCRLAANKGNAAAQYYLSSNSDSPRECLRWLTSAANQGYMEAQYALGIKYESLLFGVDRVAEAVDWYTLAASQGHVEAMYRLGHCYEHIGVVKNTREAWQWYWSAAEKGHKKANEDLSRLTSTDEKVTTKSVKSVNSASDPLKKPDKMNVDDSDVNKNSVEESYKPDLLFLTEWDDTEGEDTFDDEDKEIDSKNEAEKRVTSSRITLNNGGTLNSSTNNNSTPATSSTSANIQQRGFFSNSFTPSFTSSSMVSSQAESTSSSSSTVSSHSSPSSTSSLASSAFQAVFAKPMTPETKKINNTSAIQLFNRYKPINISGKVPTNSPSVASPPTLPTNPGSEKKRSAKGKGNSVTTESELSNTTEQELPNTPEPELSNSSSSSSTSSLSS